MAVKLIWKRDTRDRDARYMSKVGGRAVKEVTQVEVAFSRRKSGHSQRWKDGVIPGNSAILTGTVLSD